MIAERFISRAGVASRREGPALRDVAEPSGRCSVGPGFPNRLEDLLDRGREEEKDPLGHGLSIHLHREFAAVSVHHFHFDSRFLPQCVRQTGGMFSGPDSGRAFSNGYLLHKLAFLSIMIRLHPTGTTSLSRVSRLPPLAVVFIRAMLLGAVKCAKPLFGALRSDTPKSIDPKLLRSIRPKHLDRWQIAAIGS